MNCVRASWWAGFASLLICSAGLPALAQGVPGRGRAIQFSDPKVEVATSNLNVTVDSKRSSLRNLDDQFKAPFNFLESANAAGGAARFEPVLRPPTLNPRAIRQLQDKQKEESQWIFGSPEELEARRLSAERLFGVTEFDENGMEKTDDASPFQRYWDKSDHERASQTNRMGSEATSAKTDQEIKDQARAMFGIPRLPAASGADYQPAVAKSSLTPTYTSSFLPEVSPMKSSPELFAAPLTTPASQKNEAVVSRMNEFKQLFEIKNPALNGMATTPASTFSRPSSSVDFGGAPGATIRPSSATPVSSLGSMPGASYFKPPGNAAVSAFTPAPLPIAQTPRASTPPTGFQLPKRSF